VVQRRMAGNAFRESRVCPAPTRRDRAVGPGEALIRAGICLLLPKGHELQPQTANLVNLISQ
jgi:hypothetical protein